MADPAKPPMGGFRRVELGVLLFSVFFIAICGLLYELLISSASTYFLGSSILHFSVTIGLFMSSMGLGSWLSRYVRKALLERFILVEVLLGIVGGFSGIILYAAYSLTEDYYLIAGTLIVLLGTGIGLEIPLLTRIVKQYATLRDAVAQVLSFDYLGALLASLLFPLVLLPYLGTMRTSFVVGALNLLVALLCLWVFRRQMAGALTTAILAIGGLAAMGAGFAQSLELVGFFEQQLYTSEIVLAEQTRYQRIVLTKDRADFRLYLNGSLQFSTHDEHRYHEPLVHVPALLCTAPRNVLVLGGGDGLAVRELLKYPQLESVVLVDLDPRMTELARRHPLFRRINGESLHDERVSIRNQDAFEFVEHDSATYDLILIDLPDPHDTGLSKLYTVEFYRFVYDRLSPGGVMTTQATSAYFAPEAFWCIAHTVGYVFGERTLPYFTHVPTFGGVWGFVAGVKEQRTGSREQGADTRRGVAAGENFRTAASSRLAEQLAEWGDTLHLRYLRPDKLDALLVPDPDFEERPTELNRLDHQPLVGYYNSAWQQWF